MGKGNEEEERRLIGQEERGEDTEDMGGVAGLSKTVRNRSAQPASAALSFEEAPFASS